MNFKGFFKPKGDPTKIIKQGLKGPYQRSLENLTYKVEQLASTTERAEIRKELQQQLLQESPEGGLAIKQRSYSAKIATALDELESARSSGIKMINKVYSQELVFSKERLQGFKARQFTRAGYDPFHPSEQDRIANASKSENFGFIRIEE